MHDLEIFADGTASMFSARVTPWHQLGVVTADCVTAAEAMRLARLDWKVTKHPVQTVVVTEDGVSTIDVPGKYATVRTNPETGKLDPLGIVGEQYTVVQNLDNAEFLDALVGESGAHFETAGSLKNGRRTFVSMKLPETMLIGGSDRVDLYLTATNTHDGTGSFTTLVSPVRVVCANTLDYALTRAVQKIQLRHSSGVLGRIQEARDTMKMTFAYVEEFQVMAEAMLAKTVDEIQFEQVVDGIWAPTKEKSGLLTKGTTDRKLALKQLFTGAETNAFGRGTAWGALNAITEYTDWFAPETANGLTRAHRVADGALAPVKNKALRLLQAV